MIKKAKRSLKLEQFNLISESCHCTAKIAATPLLNFKVETDENIDEFLIKSQSFYRCLFFRLAFQCLFTFFGQLFILPLGALLSVSALVSLSSQLTRGRGRAAVACAAFSLSWADSKQMLNINGLKIVNIFWNVVFHCASVHKSWKTCFDFCNAVSAAPPPRNACLRTTSIQMAGKEDWGLSFLHFFVMNLSIFLY